MKPALFGNWDFSHDVDEHKAIKSGDYRWFNWDYVMAKDKVRKFQNQKFKIYAHTPGLGKDPDPREEHLMVFCCSDIKYDPDGMECPEPEKACSGYEYEKNDRVWRVWVKVYDIKYIRKTYRDLRKQDTGEPINPSGARRSFIYVCELDSSVVSPCERHPGRAGTSAQYPPSSAS